MVSLRSIRKSLRFSLRNLLAFTAAVALFFSIACTVGYIEATGALVAIGLLTWSIRMTARVWRFHARIVGIAVLWMTAVDLSWYVERCQYCWLDCDVIHARVYSVSLFEFKWAEHGRVLRDIAKDLGKPCPHRFERTHMTRCWGMFLPARPYFRGTVRLYFDEPPCWYDDKTTRILQERAEASPKVAEEFYARAILGEDRVYIRKFTRELAEERTGKKWPPESGTETPTPTDPPSDPTKVPTPPASTSPPTPASSPPDSPTDTDPPSDHTAAHALLASASGR